MSKKMKKNVSKVQNDSKNAGGKNNIKKGKEKKKPAIVEDRNMKFKSKLRKNKQNVPTKLKQLSKNKRKSVASNLVDSNVVQLVDVKKKPQNMKKMLKLKQERKQNKLNASKQKQQKKQTKHSGKSNNKIDNIEKSVKKKSNKHQLLGTNDVQNNAHTKNRRKTKQKAKNDLVKLKTVLKRKVKQEEKKSSTSPQERSDNSKVVRKRRTLNVKKLEKMFSTKAKQIELQLQLNTEKENVKPLSLRERMMAKLKSSRFRYLNETLYNSDSSESKKYFKDDPDAFHAYHAGYKQQVEQWPMNPLDTIIASIKKLPKDNIIADFGCGEARLAVSVPHTVHSFDFVSLNDNVTVCDIAHTPLLTNGVHVVVFCLSLMGTNLKDYIIEANRVLKKDGILKIAEVESRFEQVDDFIKVLSEYGFKNTWKDLSHNLFYFLNFKKEKDISGRRNKLSPITLKPCLYKKR